MDWYACLATVIAIPATITSILQIVDWIEKRRQLDRAS